MNRFFRMAVVLGLISAVGPFAIDMYLPALPSMGRSLAATPAQVQLSLSVFFVTLGVCQLFYGPLSDIIGRKAPILSGLGFFILGSLGCALAPNIETLIAFRIVQALGACAGMVIPRAVVRDLHTGHEASTLMSLLMLVVSTSPLLAPLTGSLAIKAFGWRGVFVILMVAGLASLILAVTALNETNPPEARGGNSWKAAFNSYGRLCLDAEFMGLTLVGALGVASFIVYIGSAPYVLINHFGLSPSQFSLCFALNAASFFGFGQLAGPLTRRFGLPPVIKIAVAGFALAMAILAVLAEFDIGGLAVIMALLFVGYGFLGVGLPTSAVLSLEHHGANAGTASALMGALQMFVGAAIMVVSSLFSNETPRPMLFFIAGCAVMSFVVAQATLRERERELSDATSTTWS